MGAFPEDDGPSDRAGGAAAAPAQGAAAAAPAGAAGPRAVLFDFDATLTCREELQVHRLFPEHRGFDGKIDVAWLREKGFGGEARIAQMGRMFQALSAAGTELYIVSFADRQVIVRALAILGALHFFCDRIFGWEELAFRASKAAFVRDLLQRRGWRREEVIFVDDQPRNVEEVGGHCVARRTKGVGLSSEEMQELAELAVDAGVGVGPAPPEAPAPAELPGAPSLPSPDGEPGLSVALLPGRSARIRSASPREVGRPPKTPRLVELSLGA